MQAMEASKKKGWFGKSYALMLTVALEVDKTLMSEFRHVKAEVLGWVTHRGKNCEYIQLMIVLAPEQLADCRAIVEQVYYEEGELSPIFQRLSFSVFFIDENEQVLDTFKPTPPLQSN